MRVAERLAAALAFLAPAAASAHVAGGSSPEGIWSQWDFDPVVVLPLLLGAFWYGAGLYRLWRKAGIGRGISRVRALSFAAGMAVLVLALLSPLDAVSASLFSVHMVQHLLLILAAPPLLVAGAADIAFLWALPPAWRGRFGRFEHGAGRRLMGGAGGGWPLAMVALATGILWLWHIPALYDLAVRVEAWHIAEHAAFLLSALLFWVTVLRLRPRDHVGNGMRLLYLFLMAMQGSILGALITLAARPLYQSHLAAAPQWGLTPLADQQLAGLIMWVPPVLLYLGVGAYLFVNWLNALGDANASSQSR